MTDTSLSDRLRARADYLGTIMSGDPPVQLDAESPLLLRAAAETLDYLGPFQEALRLLGFGDEYCTSTDPVDYAKRWLAERLREDQARANAERRLKEIEAELTQVHARAINSYPRHATSCPCPPGYTAWVSMGNSGIGFAGKRVADTVLDAWVHYSKGLETEVAELRARMERTGESYMAAMHALQAGKPEPQRMTDEEVVAEYGPHLGVADKEP